MVAGKTDINLCVLLYSGGLDTSCILKWIQENYKCDVITLTLDIGQRKKDFKEIEKKALNTGAKKHYTINCKEEFIREYVFPAIKANALYQGSYPLSSALSRPLIAKWGVKIALKEGADAIAHGCTGKGNDQIRFTSTIKALAPHLKVLMPVIEWGLSREEEIEFAKKHGIPIPVDVDSPYSIDENLWGRSIECGVIEMEDVEPPEDAFEWTVSPEKAPDAPEYVEIEFENGVPVSLNQEEMKPVELIQTLNDIGGKHGVGRIDHIEDRIVGFKSREVYEAPAATILIAAHKDLEKTVLTRHELEFKKLADNEWAKLVYSGLWIDPLREALEAFIDKVNERVNGKVKIKLYKGSAVVVGRKAKKSLYVRDIASYGVSSFDQSKAPGFIELWTLQSVTAFRVFK
ncbi:MAG: argininosuccinate synthase, partial [Candidatus Methanomethylicota archaeon]